MRYNTTCDVLRAERTAGAMGGYAEVYKTHLSNIPCRRSSPRPSDVAFGGARQAHIEAVVYTDPEHDIREGDRVVVDGNTYATLEPTIPSKPVYRKLMLTTIRR